MREEYTQYLADAHTAVLFRATGLSQSSANYKVCYALYYLSFRYGVEHQPGEYVIPIPLTHELIANFIGQSRENTSKTIKKLSQDKILTYNSKAYTVNTARLERYLGEDAFREIVA
jgi:CRP-like cAMP-binding protein